MKNTKELVEELSAEKRKYDSARMSGQPTGSARERMKNLLFTYAPDIVEALKQANKLAEENEVLQTELDDAEHEIDELKSTAQAKPKAKKSKEVEVPPDEQQSEQ